MVEAIVVYLILVVIIGGGLISWMFGRGTEKEINLKDYFD
jgi:hypothetical protein